MNEIYTPVHHYTPPPTITTPHTIRLILPRFRGTKTSFFGGIKEKEHVYTMAIQYSMVSNKYIQYNNIYDDYSRL